MLTKEEIHNILTSIFNLDNNLKIIENYDYKIYIFQYFEMDELLELSKQIKLIDSSNSFIIRYIPKYDGFTIYFFKWLE